MAGKFDLKKSPSGKYMFNLKAGNNQIVLTSELYESKSAAENGIALVEKHVGDEARYERRVSKNGKPHFVLNASNGQVIGKSEMYSNTSGMESGIASVKKHGPDASVADNT